MEVMGLVVETALRALLYSMEAEMGEEEARATLQYQRMEKRLADLEARHVAEMTSLLGLSGP
jgi:hypothetical protein